MNKKQSRTSENAKGKHLNYTQLKMADYLCPSDENISINEQKWFFKCRVEDIDDKAKSKLIIIKLFLSYN